MKISQKRLQSVISKWSPLLTNGFFWFACFLIWFGVLWHLSGGPIKGGGIRIPYADKIAHWGYFFGGAGLLSAGLFFQLKMDRPDKSQATWKKLGITVLLTLLLIGMLDEWHQSWIPERQGNDLGDLLADFLGALAGFFVFHRLHPILLPAQKENPT